MRLIAICAAIVLPGAGVGADGERAEGADRSSLDVNERRARRDGKDLVAKKLITKRVLEGGTYSVNVRHISGAETALSHGKITEVWVVRDGSGIVATGGTLVDPKPGDGPASSAAVDQRWRRADDQGGRHRVHSARRAARHQGIGVITYMNIRFETK